LFRCALIRRVAVRVFDKGESSTLADHHLIYLNVTRSADTQSAGILISSHDLTLNGLSCDKSSKLLRGFFAASVTLAISLASLATFWGIDTEESDWNCADLDRVTVHNFRFACQRGGGCGINRKQEQQVERDKDSKH
jgi:hypothetical protein